MPPSVSGQKRSPVVSALHSAHVCVCVCEKRYITVKSADLANSLVPRPSHRPVFDR